MLELNGLIASQLNRLKDALSQENEFNVCIVLHEANLLLSNPGNQELIAAARSSPSFELSILRLWSLVGLELSRSKVYSPTVVEYAGALDRALRKLIRRHFLDHSLPSATPGGAVPPRSESIDE